MLLNTSPINDDVDDDTHDDEVDDDASGDVDLMFPCQGTTRLSSCHGPP